MVAVTYAVLGDRHLAEDAAQEGFVKAWRKLSQLKDKGNFPGWLAVICRNTARKMTGKRRMVSIGDDFAVACETEEQVCDELVTCVTEAIAKLSAAARELVMLRYYGGKSYRQISEISRMSEQAVNGRLRRAKKAIADHLRRSGFNEVNYE